MTATPGASAEGVAPVGEPHPATESRLAQYYGMVVVAVLVWAILFFLGKRNEVQVRYSSQGPHPLLGGG